MGPSGKWIEGINADGSVEDAARRSLEARLTAVAYYLPLAAHLAEQDVEHVHRLRVSTRRSVAALKLYRDRLPSKPRRWLKKRLRKSRRAAGAARDLDVLAARLEREYGERAAPILPLIAAERAAVQPELIAVAERSHGGDRFVRKIAELLTGIGVPNTQDAAQDGFRDWAKRQFALAADPFFDAMPGDAATTAELHQFRIRAKALRYTIELVAPAFAAELQKKHYPVVESLQERLGKVQDHVAAKERLEGWSSDPRYADHRGLLQDLAAAEDANVSGSADDFRRWWTAERAQSLRSALSTAE